MTRFVMTAGEAASMVLKAVPLACGGEVFVTKMPVVSIADLADVMIELLAPCYGRSPEEISVVESGARAGEKLYEELLSEEEATRSKEREDLFVILPAFEEIYRTSSFRYHDSWTRSEKRSYVSSDELPMTRDDLRDYLVEKRVPADLEEITRPQEP